MTEKEFLKREILVHLGEKLKSSEYKLSKSACDFTKKLNLVGISIKLCF